ncbi:hypothetical protein CMO91_02160 [Candidatus Woesearchaeota archaeon]|nr:hypothetical protein [Candidatus Woesearchaeota archaeon]|tara:strand:- start:90 stop:416 length:327 start_codon:yes stop_codon:yes gene_type:complete
MREFNLDAARELVRLYELHLGPSVMEDFEQADLEKMVSEMKEKGTVVQERIGSGFAAHATLRLSIKESGIRWDVNLNHNPESRSGEAYEEGLAAVEEFKQAFTEYWEG